MGPVKRKPAAAHVAQPPRSPLRTDEIIVFGPMAGVIDDIRAGTGRLVVVPYYPFIIIALPDARARRITDFVDAAGDRGLVTCNERR